MARGIYLMPSKGGRRDEATAPVVASAPPVVTGQVVSRSHEEWDAAGLSARDSRSPSGAAPRWNGSTIWRLARTSLALTRPRSFTASGSAASWPAFASSLERVRAPTRTAFATRSTTSMDGGDDRSIRGAAAVRETGDHDRRWPELPAHFL